MIGMGIAIAVLIFFLQRSCSGNVELTNLNTAANDTITFERNEKNQQTAEISILEGNSDRDLKNLKTKDKTIIKLQEIVKNYKGKLRSATILANTTTSTGTNVTTITKTDTVVKDSITYVYETYEAEIDNEWEKGHIIANRDSVHHSIKIRNEFEITQGMKRREKGLFKRKVPVVTIKNLNPNTVTTELRTFNVTKDQSRFGLSLQAGYGFTITGKTGIYVGGGVSFRLIDF